MIQVIRLVRDAAELHGRDLFSCTPEEWSDLLALGRDHGWDPQGTTYELPPRSKITAALRDYEPGAANDRKLVTADDALNWARALDAARNTSQFAALIEERVAGRSAQQSNVRSIAGSIGEFIQYAYGGAFTFALEDDSQ